MNNIFTFIFADTKGRLLVETFELDAHVTTSGIRRAAIDRANEVEAASDRSVIISIVVIHPDQSRTQVRGYKIS